MKPERPEVSQMTEIQMPIYLNSNIVWNPEMYSLSHYKERSIFQSNVIEYWAPITNWVIPNVIPNTYWVSSWGNTWNTRTQRPIGMSFHKGYWQIQCYTTDPNPNPNRYGPKTITRKLHIVIMKTFCYFPGCENYRINHIDCNKTNNNLYNLEWCTESENSIRAIQNNHKQVFDNATSTVLLTDQDVERIYNMYLKGNTPTEIYRKLELEGIVSKSLVSGICYKTARVAWFKKNGLL